MTGGKVLLLAENTDIGGINTYVVLLAQGLRDKGIAVGIAAVWPKSDNWLGAQCGKIGIDLTVLARRRSLFQFPLGAHKLACMIKQNGYSVIHTQGHYSDLVGRTAYLLTGRRTHLVSTVHGIAGDRRFALRAFYWLDWHTYRLTEATIANSSDTLERLGQLGVKLRYSQVVLHGVVRGAEANRLESFAALETPPNKRPSVVLFVGRLSEEKGCATLIEAAGILKDRGLSFQIVIVGEGPQRQDLERAVLERNLNAQVAFAGWQVEVTTYYQMADVVVVPSLKESLGLTVLEAMTHGRAVVASKTGGIPEIVSHNRTGLLVEPGSAENMADALERCLTDHQLRHRLADAGRNYALNNHTIEAMTDAVVAVYDRVLRQDYQGKR